MKKLWDKYKNIVAYLFFGVCTTAVNVITYWLMAHLLSASVMISTIIAWIAAVMFAYVTNRKWVFHSSANKGNEIMKELLSFFGCRFATGIVDWLCMFIFVDLLMFHDVIIKVLSNFVVIVLNYIASKLVIFKKIQS